MSFELAEKRLSADTLNFSASGSSVSTSSSSAATSEPASSSAAPTAAAPTTEAHQRRQGNDQVVITAKRVDGRGGAASEVADRLETARRELAESVKQGLLAGYRLPDALWPRPDAQRDNRETARWLSSRLPAAREAALAAGSIPTAARDYAEHLLRRLVSLVSQLPFILYLYS